MEDKFALHVAVSQHDDAALAALLAAGHCVNTADSAGATPLITACMKKHPGAIGPLLDAGAAVGARMLSGNGAAHFAAISGCAEAMRLLGERSPEALCEPNKSGDTPALMCCAAGGRPEALRALLRALGEADMTEHPTASSATTSHDIIQRPAQSRLKRVLAQANKHGDTPLLLACRTGAASCVHVLLEAGADPLARHQRTGARASELLRHAAARAHAIADADGAGVAGATADVAGVTGFSGVTHVADVTSIESALAALCEAERRREAEAEAAASELLGLVSGEVGGSKNGGEGAGSRGRGRAHLGSEGVAAAARTKRRARKAAQSQQRCDNGAAGEQPADSRAASGGRKSGPSVLPDGAAQPKEATSELGAPARAAGGEAAQSEAGGSAGTNGSSSDEELDAAAATASRRRSSGEGDSSAERGSVRAVSIRAGGHNAGEGAGSSLALGGGRPAAGDDGGDGWQQVPPSRARRVRAATSIGCGADEIGAARMASSQPGPPCSPQPNGQATKSAAPASSSAALASCAAPTAPAAAAAAAPPAKPPACCAMLSDAPSAAPSPTLSARSPRPPCGASHERTLAQTIATCAECATASARLELLSPRSAELALTPAHVLGSPEELRALSVTQLELLLSLLGNQLVHVGAELGGRSESLGSSVCAATDEISAELLSCGVGLAAFD